MTLLYSIFHKEKSRTKNGIYSCITAVGRDELIVDKLSKGFNNPGDLIFRAYFDTMDKGLEASERIDILIGLLNIVERYADDLPCIFLKEFKASKEDYDLENLQRLTRLSMK